MSTAKDGGAAFPVPESTTHYTQPGMTLRDYFAGQALAGIAAPSCGYETKRAAERAYELADAMLAAREAKQ